jgi:hypothetical protein
LNYDLPGNQVLNSFYLNSASKLGYANWWPDVSIYHGLLHNDLRGQMLTHRSPIDPIFYVHHAYYDFIWDQAQSGWKSNSNTNKTSYQYDSKHLCTATTKIPSFSNVLQDVLDSNINLGVRYALRGENITVDNSQLESKPIVAVLANYRRRRGFSIANNIPKLPVFDHCPPNLTIEYITMMGDPESAINREKHARTICEEALAKVLEGVDLPVIIRYTLSGTSIPNIPRYSFQTRPVIADGSFGTHTNLSMVERCPLIL